MQAGDHRAPSARRSHSRYSQCVPVHPRRDNVVVRQHRGKVPKRSRLMPTWPRRTTSPPPSIVASTDGSAPRCLTPLATRTRDLEQFLRGLNAMFHWKQCMLEGRHPAMLRSDVSKSGKRRACSWSVADNLALTIINSASIPSAFMYLPWVQPRSHGVALGRVPCRGSSSTARKSSIKVHLVHLRRNGPT